jgi:hypothetical protein
MNGSVIRESSRSLKEQFSSISEAWKEQSDPIFRFWAAGDWWGFPFFSLSASRYFSDKETLCLYWPLGTVVIAGPKVLDFYAGFCAHRATCLKADGKDIKVLNLISLAIRTGRMKQILQKVWKLKIGTHKLRPSGFET